MNIKHGFIAAIGAALVTGCASPLNQRWDNPQYGYNREHFTQHDLHVSESSSHEDLQAISIPGYNMDNLKALSVEDAVRIAIHYSPQLRSAGYRVDASSGRVLQAGLYPNPSLSFEGEAIGSNAGEGGESAYTIEQEIVLGGKLRLARDVAESDRLAARAEFIAHEFDIAAKVRQAYFAAVSAQERLIKREELASLASQLLEAAISQIDAGSATLPDRLRAEVVYEQTQIHLETARFEVEAAMQSLASTLGVSGRVDLPLTTSIDHLPEMPSFDEIRLATLNANSRISLARIAIVRARQSHQLAKALAVPNMTASIGPRYSDIDDETTIDLGLGIEIPLFDRNQGEIRAALSERLFVSAELEQVQLELLDEISKAWSAYKSAYSAASRYQNHLLPKAEETLDLTRQAYQSGKSDYLRLLDAQQVVIEAHIAYISSMQQLHAVAASLNALSQMNAPWRNPRNEDTPHPEETE